MNKLLKILSIEEIGWLELFIAFYPIIAGYGYGSFQLAFTSLLIVDTLLLLSRGKKSFKNDKLKFFLLFVVLHDCILSTYLPEVTSSYVNSLIASIIYCISLVIICPYVNYEKLRSALMIVAVISIIGLIYHVILIQAGQSVSPIKLPLMPDMEKTSRLYSINERPSSFYWEPQAYVSFMLAPMFFALKEKKIWLAIIFALTILLSSSTTGIVMVLLMFFFALGSNSSLYTKLFVIIGICALVYFLFTSEYASMGLEKIQSEDLRENNRTMNGILIMQQMDYWDFIRGIPYYSEQSAYDHGYLRNLIVHSDGIVFVSAIWLSLIRYGVIGLVSFFSALLSCYFKTKEILPYLVCLIAGVFSNPDFVGASFCFQMFVMYSVINKNSALNR